ncbi:MAG: hypothetical protein ABG776_07425, partial [Cyanobacteria bacterium J06555_13]
MTTDNQSDDRHVHVQGNVDRSVIVSGDGNTVNYTTTVDVKSLPTRFSQQQLEDIRHKLLLIVQKDINVRLATSLHELVKLDLYMEDQRQSVGKSKLELVPEDSRKDTDFPLAVNRVLYQKDRNKPPLALELTQKIIEVFERPDIQGKLLILGEPGSGKTTELLHLAKDLAI